MPVLFKGIIDSQVIRWFWAGQKSFVYENSKMAATHAVFTSWTVNAGFMQFYLKTYSKYVLFFSQSYFIINYWEKRRRKVFAFD